MSLDVNAQAKMARHVMLGFRLMPRQLPSLV